MRRDDRRIFGRVIAYDIFDSNRESERVPVSDVNSLIETARLGVIDTLK